MACSNTEMYVEIIHKKPENSLKPNSQPPTYAEKIEKTIEIYTKSFIKKRNLHSTVKKIEKNLSKYNIDEQKIKKAFGAKDFFKNLDDCGSWLEFRHYIDYDKTKLHTGNFCKRDKLCPACAIRRAHKQQKKFLQIIENPSYKNKDWYYIVIPVKHSIKDKFEEVYQKIDNIKKKISKQMRNGREGKSNGFFTNFEGGIYSTEVTYSSNGWNVHINLLMNCPKNTNLGRLERHGKTLSSVEISKFLEPFDSFVNSITKVDFSTEDAIKSNLVEVLKYSLKFSDLDDEKLIEVFTKTYRKRLFGSWGNLYGKGIEDTEIKEGEKLDGEFLELIYTRTIKNSEPAYKLYKKEIKKVEKNPIIFEHKFGVTNHLNKKYYNTYPLIIIRKDNGSLTIRKRE